MCFFRFFLLPCPHGNAHSKKISKHGKSTSGTISRTTKFMPCFQGLILLASTQRNMIESGADITMENALNATNALLLRALRTPNAVDMPYGTATPLSQYKSLHRSKSTSSICLMWLVRLTFHWHWRSKSPKYAKRFGSMTCRNRSVWRYLQEGLLIFNWLQCPCQKMASTTFSNISFSWDSKSITGPGPMLWSVPHAPMAGGCVLELS